MFFKDYPPVFRRDDLCALIECIVYYWLTGAVISNAGKELDFLTSTARYTQLIDKPIPLFSGGSSCIDLTLCRKHEIVTECRIDHFLF